MRYSLSVQDRPLKRKTYREQENVSRETFSCSTPDCAADKVSQKPPAHPAWKGNEVGQGIGHGYCWKLGPFLLLAEGPGTPGLYHVLITEYHLR
jgi:hypothetical protein